MGRLAAAVRMKARRGGCEVAFACGRDAQVARSEVVGEGGDCAVG